MDNTQVLGRTRTRLADPAVILYKNISHNAGLSINSVVLKKSLTTNGGGGGIYDGIQWG